MPPHPKNINASGGKLATRLAHFGATQVLEPIALAATERAIQGIQKKRGGAVSHALKSAVENRLVLAIDGTIPKSRRGGKIGENLGKFVVSDVVEPVLDASAERAVQGIQGGGRRRGGKIGENLGKFVVSDVVEPVLDASAERAVQEIQGGAVCLHCGHGARHPIKTIEHHYAHVTGSGWSGASGPRMTPTQSYGGYGFPKGSHLAHVAMEKARSKQPRQGRFVKGSQEAKDAMAKLRAMRKTA